MSIKVQSHVWDNSPAKGGELLILLAIADFADDNGVAWPSVSTLAQKSRLSERQAQRNIRNLVASGDLAIDENAGPHGTHRYRVLRVSSRHPRQNVGVTSSAKRGDIRDKKGVTPTSPKPSGEPPKKPSDVPPRKPMPRNGAAQTLLAVLYEDILRIGPPTAYEKSVGQAQALVKAGCTPEEMHGIAAWLLADTYWQKRGITIDTVMRHRDEYRASKASAGSLTLLGGKPSPFAGRGYDPLQKMDPDEEPVYFQRLAESMAETEGISVDAALERLGRKSA